MSAEKMRDEFEAEVLATKGSNGMLCDLVRNPDGEYRSACERSAWWAWKRSRAAIEVDFTEVRKTTALPDRTWLLGNDAVSAIESLGLKVKV